MGIMEPIHLSGCAIIEEGKLLLLWKKKHKHYEFPGGKVNLGESLEEAARREVREEIWCEVDIIKYLIKMNRAGLVKKINK